MKRSLFGIIAWLPVLPGIARAQESPWPHSGSLFVLTTPEGADLRATARVFEVAHFRPVGNPTDPASVEIRFDN
jgi:hypothetical protein